MSTMTRIAPESLSLAQLVTFYNEFTESSIKSFRDKATGVARVTKVLDEACMNLVTDGEGITAVNDGELIATEAAVEAPAEAVEAPVEAPAEAPKAEKPAKTEKPAKAAKTEGSKRRGPPPAYADEDTITLKRADNPKRAGTAAHARYALYRDHMTVGEYIAAGGRRSDVIWDHEHEFISSYTPRQMANSAAGRDMEDDGPEAN